MADNDGVAFGSFQHHRPLFDGAYSKDSHLWLVDDGGTHKAAERTDIGQGKVPPCVSSGRSLFWRALSARVFTCLASPLRLSWSALWITGTMRLPDGSAVAMPILISFLMMILSPSRELLISGYFLIHRITASMNRGVKVSFVFSLFSNSFFTLSRQCTKCVTSASDMLVTWGLVCTLRTIWSAMRQRILSISMISTLPLYTVMGGWEAGVSATTRAGVEVVAWAGLA